MVVWGIASEDHANDVRTFVDRFGLTFPILMDENATVNQLYAQEMAFPTAAYPQDWVIGTDGTIVYGNNGFELDAMVTAIEDELRGSDELDTGGAPGTGVDPSDAPDLRGTWTGACTGDRPLDLEFELTEQDGLTVTGRGRTAYLPAERTTPIKEVGDVTIEITPFTEALQMRFDADGDKNGDLFIRLTGTLSDDDTITGACTQGTGTGAFTLAR